jgi:Ca2+-binding RTX toxin-like protein
MKTHTRNHSPHRTQNGFRHLAASLALSLSLGTAWAKPSVESVAVSPNPLIAGQTFTITVAASPDAVQATASIVFHPGDPQSLFFPLTQQGSNFTATVAVPLNLTFKHDEEADAKIKVTVFDSNGHKAEENLRVNVGIPTITAVFNGGILTVTGDNHDNAISVSRDAAGLILVNGGVVTVTGGVPTVGNTTQIQIFGLAGNDTLLVDDSNGPMPPALLNGGDGDDSLTGSAADDVLDGGAGNDILNGRDGNDTLLGGPGDDILNGGRGTDTMSGGDGDDQFIWNPGDGSDVIEGDAGNDTMLFNGANIAETVDLSANGQRLRFFRNVANITMDCNNLEQVIFRALGGADQVTVNDLTGTSVSNVFVDLTASTGGGDAAADTVVVNGTQTNDVISVTGSTNGVTVTGLSAAVTVIGAESNLDMLVINGLNGADTMDASALPAGLIQLTLNGGAGNDQLIGSQGNDIIIGAQGTDTLFGGPGDDIFPWNPGDGSDVIEGQEGFDTMLFNGANIAEKIVMEANGERLRFTRDIAGIIMDCNGVEKVTFNALGGADDITVNNLAGTTVSNVALNLGATLGSTAGDNSADIVTINGTTNNDTITISGTPATGVNVSGLHATVSITGSEPAMDALFVNAMDGDDVVVASDLQAGVIILTVDGGPGDDVLLGSQGDDILLGGLGDDILNGGPGKDVLDGGPGANVVIQ